MSAQSLYQFCQFLFPSLKEQTITTKNAVSFGEFFDWLNLNATYIQEFHTNDPHEHGFEFNEIFMEKEIPYHDLILQLQYKIDVFQRKYPHYQSSLVQQDILRLMIMQTDGFLAQYGLDLLLFQHVSQHGSHYFWLCFPNITDEQRKQFCQQLKGSFCQSRPIQLLDPKILALFV